MTPYHLHTHHRKSLAVNFANFLRTPFLTEHNWATASREGGKMENPWHAVLHDFKRIVAALITLFYHIFQRVESIRKILLELSVQTRVSNSWEISWYCLIHIRKASNKSHFIWMFHQTWLIEAQKIKKLTKYGLLTSRVLKNLQVFKPFKSTLRKCFEFLAKMPCARTKWIILSQIQTINYKNRKYLENIWQLTFFYHVIQ